MILVMMSLPAQDAQDVSLFTSGRVPSPSSVHRKSRGEWLVNTKTVGNNKRFICVNMRKNGG